MAVIINADDFGMSHSVNEAVSLCFKKHLINRATVMTNTKSFSEAVFLAKEGGFMDKVGLHLVLDEGIPLSEEIRNNSHFCKDGKFVKGCMFNKMWLIYMSSYDRYCLKNEISFQMQTYVDAGFSLMHLDSHHLVHTSSPLIYKIVENLALRYGFKSMRNVGVYSSDSCVKRIIKKSMTKMIMHSFNTTHYFASYNDYPLDLDDIEYMSHPDICNDEIVDFLDRKTNETRTFER